MDVIRVNTVQIVQEMPGVYKISGTKGQLELTPKELKDLAYLIRMASDYAR